MKKWNRKKVIAPLQYCKILLLWRLGALESEIIAATVKKLEGQEN